MRDKQVYHSRDSEGLTSWPFWGTNRLPFLRDKQVDLFQGQASRLYGGPTFLRDKQVNLFDGKTGLPFEGQTSWPIWEKNRSIFQGQTDLVRWTLLREKHVDRELFAIEWKTIWFFQGTKKLTFLMGKQKTFIESCLQ